MGNQIEKKAIESDPFFEDSLVVPAVANLKRDPTQKLGNDDKCPRGLLGETDQRVLWQVFDRAEHAKQTHANSTVVVEAKWECDDVDGVSAVVMLGSGVLVGNCLLNESGVVDEYETGYGCVATQWVLTAGHCIYHPQKGLPQEIRVRIPDVMKYNANRADLPMLDGMDANRNERFLTLVGEPFVHPRYLESPDSFSGQNIALIKLSNMVERVGLPIQVAEMDYAPDVLTVGGYPAQAKTAYHLHVSSSRYHNMKTGTFVDTDFKCQGVDEMGDGFAIIRYSNQVTPGQSGGPISGYSDSERPGRLVGIHCNEDDRVKGENSGTLITEQVMAWIVQTQSTDSRSPRRSKESNSSKKFDLILYE